MIGNAIKCDNCNKVDVLEGLPSGRDTIYEQKWFKVTAPQQVPINTGLKYDDICSLKCLQEYSEGWTSN